MSSRGDAAAKIVLLFVFVAALNALRRGELGPWLGSKFLNAGAPGAAGETFATIGTGSSSSTVANAGAEISAAGSAAAATVDLVPVGTTMLSRRFAARWLPLVQAAAADGVILAGNGYRSAAAQQKLREAHCADPVNDPPSACHPPTAKVGTSRHETGDAIDVHLTGPGGTRSPEYVWLSRNASRFDVHNLRSEPWHWSIDGK